MGQMNMLDIQDVQYIDRQVISDANGSVRHLIKETVYLEDIKEVYASEINPSSVKAWKKHLKMTQRLTVVTGTVRFVIFDDRVGSSSFNTVEEIDVGYDNHKLLIIPPLVWYGFQCLSDTHAVIINCPDMAHDPNETLRLETDAPEVPYQWKLR